MTFWQNEKYGIKIDCFALAGLFCSFSLDGKVSCYFFLDKKVTKKSSAIRCSDRRLAQPPAPRSESGKKPTASIVKALPQKACTLRVYSTGQRKNAVRAYFFA